jgi:hypothetical protein
MDRFKIQKYLIAMVRRSAEGLDSYTAEKGNQT